MTLELVAVLIAGALGIVGTLVGTLTTTWLGRSADRRRLAAEDERRWQADRRQTYTAFLSLATAMLREIDGIAPFLPYRGEETLTDEDDGLLADGLTEYFRRWEEDLQPALSDLQLIAGGRVADLAERASGALMEITGVVESRGPFVDYYPMWLRAQDLCVVLRNAMRAELGVQDPVETTYPRPADWPWLADRPSEEEHIRRQAEIPGRPPLTPAEMARLSSARTGMTEETD